MIDFNLLKMKIQSFLKCNKYNIENQKNTNYIMNFFGYDKSEMTSLPLDNWNRFTPNQFDNLKDILTKSEKLIKTDSSEKKIKPQADWLMEFVDSCKNISNTDLQNLWSKILSGEVRGSTKTSFRSMSVLKNMTQEEAKLFQKASNYIIVSEGLGYIYLDDKADNIPKDFLTLEDLIHLLDANLISNIKSDLGSIKSPLPIKNIHVVFFGLIGDCSLYSITNQSIFTPSIFLSKSGYEIFNLISEDQKLDSEYLSYISKSLKNNCNIQLKKLVNKKKTSFEEGEDVY